jgi:hypothetical protein
MGGVVSGGDPVDNTDFLSSVLLASAGLCLAIGLIILVGTSSTAALARLTTLNNGPGAGEVWGWRAGFGFTAMAIGCGVWFAFRRRNYVSDPQSDAVRYNRHLVGIGYTLVLLALLNFVALAGFAKIDQLAKVLAVNFDDENSTADKSGNAGKPVDAAKPAPVHRLIFMLIAPGFAALGALFFLANSMRSKLEPFNAAAEQEGPGGGVTTITTIEKTDVAGAPPATGSKTEVVKRLEHFDSAQFWGGLWFRMGEALLFTLVVFLFVVGSTLGKTTGAWLLLLSLLLGMFVKTGESLVSGLADKLFAAVKAIVK